MNEIFLLKLGEIILKGANRRQFENKLKTNVARRMRPFGEFKVNILQSTVYVEPENDECDMEGAWEACQRDLRRHQPMPLPPVREDAGCDL